MCWVLFDQDQLEVGPIVERTQSSFGSDCTTGPNKFGDSKVLGLYPILYSLASEPKANSTVSGPNSLGLGPAIRPYFLGPCVGSKTNESGSNFDPASGPKGNDLCIRTQG